jgi:hypothetical protein
MRDARSAPAAPRVLISSALRITEEHVLIAVESVLDGFSTIGR